MKHALLLAVMISFSSLVGWCSPTVAQGQFAQPNNNPFETWKYTSQGMSTNSALAFYRLQSSGKPVMGAPSNRWQRSVPASRHQSVSNRRSISPYYSSVPSSTHRKPFANIQPSPNAFERYWPLLLEAREDPETGIIIWSLP